MEMKLEGNGQEKKNKPTTPKQPILTRWDFIGKFHNRLCPATLRHGTQALSLPPSRTRRRALRSPARTQRGPTARHAGCFGWKGHLSHRTESIRRQHSCRMKGASLGFSVLRNFRWCAEEPDALSFSAFFPLILRHQLRSSAILSFYKSPRCLIFKGTNFLWLQPGTEGYAATRLQPVLSSLSLTHGSVLNSGVPGSSAGKQCDKTALSFLREEILCNRLSQSVRTTLLLLQHWSANSLVKARRAPCRVTFRSLEGDCNVEELLLSFFSPLST